MASSARPAVRCFRPHWAAETSTSGLARRIRPPAEWWAVAVVAVMEVVRVVGRGHQYLEEDMEVVVEAGLAHYRAPTAEAAEAAAASRRAV